MSDGTKDLLTRAAGLLLANGQTTEGTRLTVERLSRALAKPVRFTARWGEYTLRGSDGLLSGEAVPTGIDICRVEAIEGVVDSVCAGRTEIGAGVETLQKISVSGPVHLARFAPMAAAGAAALSIIFGASDWQTVVLVAASAGGGALLRRGASRLSANPFFQPFVAALLAGIVGGLIGAIALPLNARLIVVCPCMILVPGPHFLNGGLDLMRARIPIGGGRIVFALLIILAICAGLLVGLSVTHASFPQSGAPVTVPFASDVIAAAVAVAAYGSFFNMPWRLLAVPVLLGMAAHAAHWYMLLHGASTQLSAFGAALIVGATIAPLSHRFRIPFGPSAFAAVVSLIPGVFMFETASAGLTAADLGTKANPALLMSFIGNGVTAMVVLLSIASGLILPKMIVDSMIAKSGQQESP